MNQNERWFCFQPSKGEVGWQNVSWVIIMWPLTLDILFNNLEEEIQNNLITTAGSNRELLMNLQKDMCLKGLGKWCREEIKPQ